ncbi:MAG: FAD-dependent oxidoreductase, partial [Anaerofustis stercorihominis]|nr:FAD-dependent oxidoreductase [Anaerofustis stercorihominis]
MKFYDVCIIGGGAAGLCAAASLDKNIRTCLLEKNSVLGRKVMATG